MIGASRGLGRQVVMAALEDGHIVTAFARHPERLDMHHPRLQLKAGNVLEAASLERVMRGQQAVICTLGLPTRQAMGPPFARRSYVLSTGTENIIKAMEHGKVRRLVCVTAIGTGDSVRQCTLATKLTLRYGLHWLFREKDRQETIIDHSDLDWTVVRPTALTNGRRGGHVISKDVRSGVLTHISRADVAAWIVRSIDQSTDYQKAVTLSYPPRLGDSLRWLRDYLSA